MASLPRDGRAAGEIITKAEKPNHPCALSRTKDDFHFTANLPGVCILDYDPPFGEIPLTCDQLWALLLATVPGLESAGVIWWCSGSSYIYQGETEIQPLKGQRIYILIQDLADTERFGEVLFKRLWLAGHGRIEISKAGSLLSRSIFDQAMAQAARLDFIGGAVCEAPLEQRRGQPVILANGGWLDTRAALPDLSTPEQAAYVDLVEATKLKAEPEADVIRGKWQAERMPSMVDRLVKSGVPTDQAQDRVERTLSSALRGALLGDFSIILDGGKVVTVGEILDDCPKYHGLLTKDPLEPEYQGGKTCGKFYLFGSSPILTSRAHGGQTFRLLRQPARLYVQKGSKAQLADQIIDRLNLEPDLYEYGGVLVRIENGTVRHLRKHALMHAIQSRMAFFTTDSKGRDMPADLPGDVADMVLAVLEK